MSIFPTRILLSTDGSRVAESALWTAVNLAKSTDSELQVLTVGMPDLPEYVELLEETRQRLEREAEGTLEEQVRRIEEEGGMAVAEAHLSMQGPPAREIVHLAEEMGAGLIVMGSRGLGGLRRALMGSVSDPVVRYAHCPVVVVRIEPVVFPTTILVATDGSREANLALKSAADLAHSTGSALHVAHTIPTNTHLLSGDELLAQDAKASKREAEEGLWSLFLEPIENTAATVTQTHLLTGRPDAEILTLAEDLRAKLIVMGTRGRGGVHRVLMGSVSDSVVRHAHCPVMVVRTQKERSAEH